MKLRAIREQSGKTQAQVAKEANISVRLYQFYETDQKEPGVRTAIRIADVLNVKDLREMFVTKIAQCRAGSSDCPTR